MAEAEAFLPILTSPEFTQQVLPHATHAITTFSIIVGIIIVVIIFAIVFLITNKSKKKQRK